MESAGSSVDVPKVRCWCRELYLAWLDALVVNTDLIISDFLRDLGGKASQQGREFSSDMETWKCLGSAYRAWSDACCENILESTGFRRMFSFLSLQEMNTSTKSKGYWAGLLQPVNKGEGITKVFSAEGRNSYLLVHNVAEQLSQSVQLIMMQVTCLYMTSSYDSLVLNITFVSLGRKN